MRILQKLLLVWAGLLLPALGCKQTRSDEKPTEPRARSSTTSRTANAGAPEDDPATDTSRAGASGPELSEAKLEKLSEFAERARETWGIPGLSMAVVRGPETVWASGFGVEKRGTNRQVTPDSLMAIGSTTKSMTTALMAKAVDEGAFRWDTAATEVVPNFALATDERTRRTQMQHLVCNCTGVARRETPLAFEYDQLSPSDLIRSLNSIDYAADFGEEFHYSNQMVAAAGYGTGLALTDAGEGMQSRYWSALRTHVLDPIGMEQTKPSVSQLESESDHAHPHGIALGRPYEPIPLSMERSVLPTAPAGSVWSNANEMARYVSTQIRRGKAPDGSRVVSKSNLEETWKPRVGVQGDAKYSLGWFQTSFAGERVLSHGGNTNGFTSDLAFVPSDRIGIVVLSNAFHVGKPVRLIRRRFLELAYSVDEPKAATLLEKLNKREIQYWENMKSRTMEGVARDRDRRCLGEYTHELVGDVEVRSTESELLFDVGEFAMEIRRVQPAEQEAGEDVTVFEIVESPKYGLELECHPGDDGNTELVYHSRNRKYRLEHTDN